MIDWGWGLREKEPRMILLIPTYINGLDSEAADKRPGQQVRSFSSDSFSLDHKYTVLSVCH